MGSGVESVRCGGLIIASLLYANDEVLLASSDRDLQCSLGWFVDKHEAHKSESAVPLPSFTLPHLTRIIHSVQIVNTICSLRVLVSRFQFTFKNLWTTLFPCRPVQLIPESDTIILQTENSPG